MADHHWIASKLAAPPPMSSEVRRTNLDDALARCPDTRTAFVRAPAGFGKTTLLAQFCARMREAGVATAWFRVDEDDNDPARFFAYLTRAFAQIDRVEPERSRHGHSPFDVHAAGADLIRGLIERIAAWPGRFVLCVDDFEKVQCADVLDHFSRLVEQLPDNALLVIGSRMRTVAGLARLRAKGLLCELGPDEIRFSPQETTALLRDQRGLALDEAQIGALHRRTEGWPAALHLIALSLAGRTDAARFVAAVANAQSDIADYLTEDVLAHQPDDVQRFLRETSVLDRLSAPLCDAVTGRQDSRDLLDRLQRANLFVVPLDGESGWYRYHGLFASFLRERLAPRDARDAQRLHRAASAWYGARDMHVLAVDHALAAGERTAALTRVAACAASLLHAGRVGLLCRWLDRFCADELQSFPALRVAHAWAMMFLQRYDDALALLDALDADPSNAMTGEQRLAATTLRVMNVMHSDDLDSYTRLVRDVVVPDEPTFAGAWLKSIQAGGMILRNELPDARAAIDEAIVQHRALGCPLGEAYSEGLHGAIELIEGRLRDAIGRYRCAYEHASDDDRQTTLRKAALGILYADTLYLAGRLDEAEALVERSLPIARESGVADLLIIGQTLRVRIHAQLGRGEQARDALAEFERLGHARGLPRLSAHAWLERARLALLEGNLSAARHYQAQAARRNHHGDAGVFTADLEPVEIADLRLRMNDPDDADGIAQAGAQLALALRDGRLRRALKLRILLAIGHCVRGDVRLAAAPLQDALTFACREGFVQPFAEEGRQMAALLDAYRWTTAGSAWLAANPHPAAFVAGVECACNALPDAARETVPAGTIDGLTDREHGVLVLLAEGLANRAIGERLFVSETTVKFHLRNISAKLGASNRTQAIVIARRSGLIV
ncbi:LuxR C-terminal-related transcriptional regulator [Paraburkholderia phytofirmans]|uniref:LuxR C-terminal-related transcriptional regulator n=1 Tax=Paraburkholderia phytofirmans TaxID=261302 RepID=UPI0038BD7136